MEDQGEAAQMYQLTLVGTVENGAGDIIYNLEVVDNQLMQGENKMLDEDMDKSVEYSCEICKKVCNSQRSLSLNMNSHNAPDKVKTNTDDAVINGGCLFEV